ncbi:MAG: Flp pilus assembly protein CpaB [Solirubrobacterales bacterium]
MKGKMVLFVAVLMGVLTAFLAFVYIKTIKDSIDKTPYTTRAVAAQLIPQNTAITVEMIKTERVPTAVKHPGELTDPKDIIGKIALVAIPQGEIIQANTVVKPGDPSQGFSYVIPEGKRAMTIEISDTNGVNGMLRGGNRVDLITTVSGQGEGGTVALVVLQDIEVLAVGALPPGAVYQGQSNPAAKTVTLCVSLSDALRLKAATSMGQVQLLLRSPAEKPPAGAGLFSTDSSPIYTGGFRSDDFLNQVKAGPPAAPAAKPAR